MRVHAFTDDALGDLDAVGLAEHLGAGKVTPTEVVEAAIARVEKVAGELNAMAFTAYGRRPIGAALHVTPSALSSSVRWRGRAS